MLERQAHNSPYEILRREGRHAFVRKKRFERAIKALHDRKRPPHRADILLSTLFSIVEMYSNIEFLVKNSLEMIDKTRIEIRGARNG